MYECNWFKHIGDTDCTNVVKVSSVLYAIKNGRWKEQMEEIRAQESKGMITRLKKKLPSVTFSGVFEDTREDKNIVYYSGLMVIDIDTIGPNKLTRLREDLKHNPFCLAYFQGPSKGIKVLFHVDTESNEHSTYAFLAVQEHFKELYNVIIDPSGKNIARLCFVSYDPDAFINESPRTFIVDRKVYNKNNEAFRKVGKPAQANSNLNINDIFKTARKMVNKSKAGTYHKGNRNNYIFVLSCLLSDFGVPMQNTLHEIANRYESLEPKEIKTTVESAYRKAKHSFGSKTDFNPQQGGLF
jgi:hypothetical protein